MAAVIDRYPDPGLTALPDRTYTTRVAAGIAMSLAIHVLLLSVYRAPRPAASPMTEPLTVRLRTLPAPPPAAEPVRSATQPPTQHTPAKPRSRPARRIIAVPPAATAPDENRVHVEPQPAAPPVNPNADAAPADAPRFNLDAARSVARRVANEPDPAKAGTALERLPPPPLQTESKLERGIKGAKRPNCKDGVPGGLLAPLFLAMDKKDSGCKW